MSEDTVAGDLATAISDTAAVADGFLLGYTIVAEWMTGDSKRWLSVISGTGTGEDIPPWQMRGYLNEVLNNWSDDYETNDEDEE